MALICTVSATLSCQHLEWADYIELVAWDNYPYLAFVAEGRIGNAVSGGGTHEIDVGYTTGGPFRRVKPLTIHGQAAKKFRSFSLMTASQAL